MPVSARIARTHLCVKYILAPNRPKTKPNEAKLGPPKSFRIALGGFAG
jgi:hypothetical protein